MLKKIATLFIIVSISACANSTIEKSDLTMPCEVQNEYGAIGCGVIPLSINQEISKQFKEECPFDKKTVDADYIRCLKKYKDNPLEAFQLGNIEYYVNKNIQDGIKLIEFSSNKKYPEAMIWLAKYYDSLGEFDKSLLLMKEAATLGNPLAMYSLGFRYRKGIGVKVDNELALEWLDKSLNFVPAAYSEIATIYLTDGNVEKFIEYNNKALEKKYWFANVDLAILYLGDIPKYENYRDLKKSQYYANELISEKISVGYFIKAQILQKESGEKSNPQICNSYKKSYDGGFMLAGVNLASEYLTGKNCNSDYQEALTIFNKLFFNTVGETKIMSATNLGYIYLNGIGVARDKVKSKEYLQYAANFGYQPAIDMLNTLN